MTVQTLNLNVYVNQGCCLMLRTAFSSWWKTALFLLHCVQKKTPTHIFFHISMSDV